MSAEITIPKLGLTMTEGTVSKWVADEGAEVSPGDVVLLLTTDKLETEVEAGASGVVHHAVPEGTTLECGATAGWLLAEGEQPPTRGDVATQPSTNGHRPDQDLAAAAYRPDGDPVAAGSGGRRFVSPNARRVARDLGIDLTALTGSGPGGRVVSEDVVSLAEAPTALPSAAPARGDLRVSPVARRLADKAGITLDAVVGTGPGGRILLDDVLAASGRGPGARAPASPAPAGSRHRAGDVVPFAGMRKVIAERMHASLQEMAQLTLTAEVTMDAALDLRERLKADWTGTVPSVTDLILRAGALSLVEHPLLNATVRDAGIHLLEDVHVGLAVSVPDGLLVPVVRHADLLPLDALAAETSRLADAARTGGLGPDDLEGGTFSITALGTAGIDAFTPVVNPPNVAILGVGRIRDGVAWDGDAPVRTQVITLSLSIDHRVVDGAPGAAFLGAVRAYLEHPLRLLS